MVEIEERIQVDADAGQGHRRNAAAADHGLAVGAVGLPLPSGKRLLVRVDTPDLQIPTSLILRQLAVDIGN